MKDLSSEPLTKVGGVYAHRFNLSPQAALVSQMLNETDLECCH